ncbi:hypothetical protein F5B19DRAFT_440776 [Rostrohypoxylon terebratum]|nr:hypothetical protein F5B19DRAFT_440776 [Rostrohypoxylon terebratum]
MVNLALAYPLLLLASIAVAIYVQVTSGSLSLPLSIGTTVLAIILPFIAVANVFYTPLLHRFLQSRTRSLATQQLLPIALQVIQGILEVVLATLFAQGFVPGKLLECSLEGNWQRLYSAKDDQALQRIQDSFNCCGLRSTRDRDFPRTHQCLTTYPSRTTSCLEPWLAAEQRTAGLGFAAVVVVGVLQLIHLALFRLRNSGGARARLGYRRLTQSVGADPNEGLLENQIIDEEDGPAAGRDGTNGSRREYGTLEDGANHRIEPTGLGEESNNWR